MNTSKSHPRIFMSHSSKDNEFGVKLVQDLRNVLGEDAVWYDVQGGLHGGDIWWDKIKEELSARPIFLVVLSPSALASDWVNDEINMAWRQKNSPSGKRIIPILYRACKLPEDLDSLPTTISFISPKPYEKAFQELLEALGVQSQRTHVIQPRQRSIARRTILLGLAGLAVAGAAGGGFLWLRQHNQEPLDPSITSAGTMFGFDLQRTHFNPDEHVLSPVNVSNLVQYWTASTDGVIYASPTVANGVVYLHSEDHKLYALSATTGALLWSSFTAMKFTRYNDNYYDYSSPAVARGVVYIGSGEKDLYAFNAATGKLLWTATTGSPIGSSPAVSQGIVYVASNDHLYAFNARTGNTIWSVRASFDLFFAINAPPAIANGKVYVGAYDYQVHAFDAITGNSSWTSAETPLNGTFTNHAPAVANGRVYVGTGDPALYTFDAATGKTLWSVTAGHGVYTPPAIANEVVYVGSSDHNLYAFDATTGKKLWSASTGDTIGASPTVANGVVYVGSYDTNLYAFDATTGKKLWSAPTGDAIESSPTVANGVVYIGSNDRTLYAFHLPNTTA